MLDVRFDPNSLCLVFGGKGSTLDMDELIQGDTAFVWGLLMEPSFVARITGGPVAFAPAHVRGYRREVRRVLDGIGFRLVEEAGGVVNGALLLGLTVEARAALDEFERVDVVMRKQPIIAYAGDREVETSIYLHID